MNKLYSYIFFFSIISIITFFFAVFIFQVGDELILTKVHNITNSSGADLGISDAMQTHLDDTLADYQTLSIPYDLFFLASFIGIFGLSLITAYNSREESYMSFFGALTIMMMIFLFITSFIITVADWLVLNLIQSVVAFDLNTTPIFNYYLDNLGLVNFIWAFILVVVNKLPFTLRREEDDIPALPEDNFEDIVEGEFEK